MVQYSKVKSEKTIGRKGLVICNIGEGKGKTTAAMGAAIRASGAGLNVFILQFVKAKKPKDGDKLQSGEWPLSNEINFLDEITLSKKLGRIDTDQVGEGFVGILGDRKDLGVHIKEAVRGLEMARQLIHSGNYQLIVLDEILSAVDLKLISQQDIIDLLETKPGPVHIIMTGHAKYPKIFALCDTVTDMKVVKHAYYEGILAQRGIDF